MKKIFLGVAAAAAMLSATWVQAQQPARPQPVTPAQPVPGQTPDQTPPDQEQTPGGKVVVSSDHPPAAAVSESSSSVPENQQAPPDVKPAVKVKDAERAAVAVTAWDMDLHLVPAEASAEVLARLTLRNLSATRVERVALQISSALRWQAVRDASGRGLAFTQSPIETDADHTSLAEEAVITLAEPLAAGATLRLAATYAGEIHSASERLQLLGASPEKAALAAWDEIAPTSDTGATALRGFGNVLWYPVSSPTAVLGDGNKLVALLAAQKELGLAATMRLRLTVEYAGDPPNGAILNGKLQSLLAVPDEQDALVSDVRGIATTEFAATPLGFRVPSLFLTAQQPETAGEQTLVVVSPRAENAAPYRAAAELVKPLLQQWFGETPTQSMLLLDHPGEEYADGSFLVAQLAARAEPDDIATTLVSGLTHAWFRAPGAAEAWLDQGMPEFMSLLWLERTQGHEAALAQVRHAGLLVALAEPDAAHAAAGQALVAAQDDVYLRLKAALVLWQLREILGDAAFREALLVYRHSLGVEPATARDGHAFERVLERSTGRDLAWYFNDWVYADKGLADLSVAAVNPRTLPSKGGKSGGYLVAVEVRNEGDAAAEVPVTVRSGSLTATERLRVPAHGTAATRVLFEGRPETVSVNDGSVPEMRDSTHVLQVTLDAN